MFKVKSYESQCVSVDESLKKFATQVAMNNVQHRYSVLKTEVIEKCKDYLEKIPLADSLLQEIQTIELDTVNECTQKLYEYEKNLKKVEDIKSEYDMQLNDLGKGLKTPLDLTRFQKWAVSQIQWFSFYENSSKNYLKKLESSWAKKDDEINARVIWHLESQPAPRMRM